MENTSDFFKQILDFNNLDRPEPKPGLILVSEPYMPDPHFSRSVILLGEHNEDGTFGFVLNHYIRLGIDKIIKNFPVFKTRISKGGPVKTNNLYYIHRLGKKIPGSITVCKGVYMGGSYEKVFDMIISGELQENDIRFFLGYAGWSKGQLHDELEQRAWIVARTSADEIFNTRLSHLWEDVLKRLGGKFKVISNFPVDPRLN